MQMWKQKAEHSSLQFLFCDFMSQNQSGPSLCFTTFESEMTHFLSTVGTKVDKLNSFW